MYKFYEHTICMACAIRLWSRDSLARHRLRYDTTIGIFSVFKLERECSGALLHNDPISGREDTDRYVHRERELVLGT